VVHVPPQARVSPSEARAERTPILSKAIPRNSRVSPTLVPFPVSGSIMANVVPLNSR